MSQRGEATLLAAITGAGLTALPVVTGAVLAVSEGTLRNAQFVAVVLGICATVAVPAGWLLRFTIRKARDEIRDVVREEVGALSDKVDILTGRLDEAHPLP
jgi:hypothetical protein